jgi:hypothetical protein
LHSSAFDVALQYSSLALEYAEKAFFDDKMVSMLYFPDEHKYAIYTPLFGPLALPLLMALLKELRGVVKLWRMKQLNPNDGEEDVIVVKEDVEGNGSVIVKDTEPIENN